MVDQEHDSCVVSHRVFCGGAGPVIGVAATAAGVETHIPELKVAVEQQDEP